MEHRRTRRSRVCLSLIVVGLALSLAGRAIAQPEQAPVPEGPAPVPDTWGAGRPGGEAAGQPDPAAPPTDPAEATAPAPPGDTPSGSVPEPPRRRSRAEKPTADSVRYTLEAIELRGNVRTRARVVLRYLPFQPGDMLDVDDPAV